MSLTIFLNIFLLPFLTTSVIAYLLSPIVMALYHRLGWLDDPRDKQHIKVVHTYPVPRGGGVVVFVALFTGILLFLSLDKHLAAILVGALILTITGLLDDIYDLNPYLRLFLGVMAALFVVGSGIGIGFITNPFGSGVIHFDQPQLGFSLLGQERALWLLADVFAIIWIVWCMNMLNWAKGLDGQLPGIVVVAATVVAVLSFQFTEDVTQWPVSILAAILGGAYLGFLPWNLFPQKMMPGYGGGSLAGYLLAILSILSGAKLATLIIVLGVPMVDALYVIVRRIMKKRSPVWGDRSHFHHRLLDLGWSKRQVAFFYWLMSLVLGVLALQLNARQKLFTILVLSLGFGGALLWLNYFISSSKRRDRDNG